MGDDVQYETPGFWAWLANPGAAAATWAGITAYNTGAPAYEATLAIPAAYQEALRAGYQGTYEEFRLQAQAAIAGASAGARGVGRAPSDFAEYVGVGSQDPYTDAVLGVVRLATIGGLLVGGVWVTFKILDKWKLRENLSFFFENETFVKNFLRPKTYALNVF